jgi:ATP-binding cassette subfamily B protein
MKVISVGNKYQLLRSILVYKKNILFLSFLGLISSGFFFAGPFLSKLFIDTSFLPRDLRRFLTLTAIGAVIFLLSTAFRVFEDIVRKKMSVRAHLTLANKFMRNIYYLDLGFFQSESVGEKIYRISHLESNINFLFDVIPRALVDSIKLPIILLICLCIDAHLTVVMVILSPIFIFRSLYIQKKMKPLYAQRWKSSASLAKLIYESFSRMVIIKAFGLEVFQKNAYMRLLINNIRLQIKSFRLNLINSIASTSLSKALYGVISLYGGWLIIRGKITLGSFTAVMIYLTQLGGLLESLCFSAESFVQQSVYLEKFFEIFHYRLPQRDFANTVVLHNLQGAIRFEGVWFGYRENNPIIKGLTLDIPIGMFVGIAGASGCGKTTLMNLVLGLYRPEKGKVLFNGLDAEGIQPHSLRQLIGVAAQEPFLFDLSFRENITLGLRNVNEDELVRVCKVAQIDDYIRRLPQGYETLTGENAFRLSQGYKQRVALARALIRNPLLLILDEATSSIDSVVEQKILAALRENMKGKTVIVISHRLSTIRYAERIFFFREDGKLEEGVHEDLFSRCESYRHFFKDQIEL